MDKSSDTTTRELVMIKTIPMDPSWKQRLRDRSYTADSPLQDPLTEGLKQKLLSYGGEAVVWRSSGSEARNILSRGELFVEDDPIRILGLHNECHSNSSMNFLEMGHLIMTGYALSEDGAWREHSWNRDPVSGRIIETTELRAAYYGYEMDEAEAAKFADENKRAPDPIYLRGDCNKPFTNLVVIADLDNFSLQYDADAGAVELRFGWKLPNDPNIVRLWIVEREAKHFFVSTSIDMYEVTHENEGTVVRSDRFSRFDPSVSMIRHAGLVNELSGLGNGVLLTLNEDSPEFAHLNELAWKNYYAD